MPSKQEMQDGLVGLNQALMDRKADVLAEPSVFTKWFGTKMTCGATLGRANDWYRLPARSDAFADPVASIATAVARVGAAQGKAQWLSALQVADLATVEVSHLLDHPPLAA